MKIVADGIEKVNHNSPHPLPPLKPDVMAFDDALVPESLRPWCVDVVKRLGCPPDFASLSVMSVLSACVGSSLAIRPKHKDVWIEACNLWGAVIGPPSSMKSPAISEIQKPLRQLEAENHKNQRESKLEHEKAITAYKKFKEKLEKEANKVESYDDVQRIMDKLPPEPAKPPCKRHIQNDTTMQRLCEVIADNPRGILLFRDELAGWLQSLEMKGRETDRAFYLEAYNGTNPYSQDTIGRGDNYMDILCLSIFGGIQPGPFESYMKGEGRKADGLLSRFSLLVYPDCQPWELVDESPDTEARKQAYEVIERLAKVNDNKSGYDVGNASEHSAFKSLQYSGNAQERFNEWIVNHQNKLNNPDLPNDLVAHLSKYRKAIPVISLLIELADNSQPDYVSGDSLAVALKWCEYLESHANRIYATSLAPEIQAAHLIRRKIEGGKLSDGFTNRDIYRPQWHGLKDPATVDAGISVLLEYNNIRHKSLPGSRHGQYKILI